MSDRIASHPDDPDAPLADRLLLALGMWPSYVEQLGADTVVEAAAAIKSAAHRFPMAAEDYGAMHDKAFWYRHLLERVLGDLDLLAAEPELHAAIKDALRDNEDFDDEDVVS